jgi:hypothetical protein
MFGLLDYVAAIRLISSLLSTGDNIRGPEGELTERSWLETPHQYKSREHFTRVRDLCTSRAMHSFLVACSKYYRHRPTGSLLFADYVKAKYHDKITWNLRLN